ncbi:MAG: PaaI family thioesterase [Acidimicrobiia bacterium]
MAVTPAEVNAFLAENYPDAVRRGVSCVDVNGEGALVRWSHDPTTLRPGGLISGPIQFALADLALYCAAFGVVGIEPMAVTSRLAITFLRPAAGGDLYAQARVLRAGRTRIYADVELWVEGDPERVVSHAVGEYALPRGEG